MSGRPKLWIARGLARRERDREDANKGGENVVPHRARRGGFVVGY